MRDFWISKTQVHHIPATPAAALAQAVGSRTSCQSPSKFLKSESTTPNRLVDCRACRSHWLEENGSKLPDGVCYPNRLAPAAFISSRREIYLRIQSCPTEFHHAAAFRYSQRSSPLQDNSRAVKRLLSPGCCVNSPDFVDTTNPEGILAKPATPRQVDSIAVYTRPSTPHDIQVTAGTRARGPIPRVQTTHSSVPTSTTRAMWGFFS